MKFLSILFFFVGMISFSPGYTQRVVDSTLCQIFYKDQYIRRKFLQCIREKAHENLLKVKSEMDSLDKAHELYVTQVLDSIGWPEEITQRANEAIFIVINHGNNDLAQRYFSLVDTQMRKGHIPKYLWATLKDKVLVRSGEKQVYGTQIKSWGNKYAYIWPIEAPEEVDQRRTEVGLVPMEKYLKLLQRVNPNVVWDKNITIADIQQEILKQADPPEIPPAGKRKQKVKLLRE